MGHGYNTNLSSRDDVSQYVGVFIVGAIFRTDLTHLARNAYKKSATALKFIKTPKTPYVQLAIADLKWKIS